MSKDNFDVSALNLAINSAGTYLELCSATQNRSLLRYNSSGVNFEMPVSEPKKGLTYSLGDLLSRVPELQEQHFRWRGFNYVAHLNDLKTDGEERESSVLFNVSKRSGVRLEQVNRIFEGAEFKFLGEKLYFEYQCPCNPPVFTGALQ